MDPNAVFFWMLVGPTLAFIVLGIAAAAVALVGVFIGAANDGLRNIVSSWRSGR